MEFNATFIVSFISFIVFVIIMNFVLYKPVGEIVSKRKNLVDGNYQNARANKKKSENILKDRLDKLNCARGEVREKTTVALNKIKQEKRILEKEAHEEINKQIENNISALNQDKQEAINILKQDVLNLAQMISDKFVESNEKISEINDETIEQIMQG